MSNIDIKLLEQIISDVEASLIEQDLQLSAQRKAKLVAELYVSSLTRGEKPGRIVVDRLVWLAN